MEFLYPIILAHEGVLTFGGMMLSIAVTVFCFYTARRQPHRITRKSSAWVIPTIYLGPLMLILPIAAEEDLPGLPAVVLLLCIVTLYLSERLWARQKLGELVLHVVVFRGAPESVTKLLDAEADTEARTVAGETVLDLAKSNSKMKGTEAYRRLKDAQFR